MMRVNSGCARLMNPAGCAGNILRYRKILPWLLALLRRRNFILLSQMSRI